MHSIVQISPPPFEFLKCYGAKEINSWYYANLTARIAAVINSVNNSAVVNHGVVFLLAYGRDDRTKCGTRFRQYFFHLQFNVEHKAAA